MTLGKLKLAGSTVLALILLAGCATTPKVGGDPGLRVLKASELPAPPMSNLAPGESPYVVGPRDKLIIDVYGIEALTRREVLVDTAGWISFPLAGQLEVSGKTIGEIRADLTDKLVANFVRNPRVTINVSEIVSQTVTVEGQVHTPGLYPIEGRTTLMQAIAQAQGTDEFTKLDDVVIFRTVAGQRYAGLYDLKAIRHGAYPDPEIFAHDVVMVGDSHARRIFKDVLQIVPLLTSPLVIAIDRLTQ